MRCEREDGLTTLEWVVNHGTGEPRATATRLLPADQAVYHDEARPSAVILPVRQAQ